MNTITYYEYINRCRPDMIGMAKDDPLEVINLWCQFSLSSASGDRNFYDILYHVASII